MGKKKIRKKRIEKKVLIKKSEKNLIKNLSQKSPLWDKCVTHGLTD